MDETDIEILRLKQYVTILQMLFLAAYAGFSAALTKNLPATQPKLLILENLQSVHNTMVAAIQGSALSPDQQALQLQELDRVVQSVEASINLLVRTS